MFLSFGQRIISFWSESVSLNLSKNLFLPFSEVPWQDLAKRGRDRNLEQTLSLNVEIMTQQGFNRKQPVSVQRQRQGQNSDEGL